MTLDVFDKAISRKGIPTHFRDAAVELNDTMELAWASAQSVFGKAAKPEHAIALLPMFMERADAIRQQLEVAELLGTAPAPTPAPRKPSRAARPGSSKAT